MKSKRIAIVVFALMFALSTISINAYARGNNKTTSNQGNAQIQQGKKETKKSKQNKKGNKGNRSKKHTSI